MVDLKELPWNIKLQVLRAIKGWSQYVTAEKCGTTQRSVWLWEQGRAYPVKNSRAAIARAFGVEEEEIFGGGL